MSSIASISGNISIDLAIVIFVSAELLRLAMLIATRMIEASDDRAKLKALRATLEFKSSEIAALRLLLTNARKEHLAQQELVYDQHQDRLSTALFMSSLGMSHDHSELEDQLRYAASRARFDA